MTHKILAILISLCLPVMVSAQQTLSSKDMVAITPMVSQYIDLPSDAVASLEMKLNQIATQNGLGSISSQFVLTANVVTLDKQATATAPPQFVVDLEVSFFVVNVIDGIIVDEISYPVKGVDRLENKATIQAINQIKPKSPQIRIFMNKVREEIITYYNTRIPALLTKAQSLADRNNYDQALYVLSAIPESVDQYAMVAEQMSAIYIKKVDRSATSAIQEAKGLVAIRDYEKAIKVLLAVDPSSTKSNEAFEIIEQIKNAVNEEERRIIEEELKIYEDQKEIFRKAQENAVMLKKLQIEAAQKIGVEKAKVQNTLSDSLDNWFLNMFKAK